MKVIEWTNDFALGIDEIDGQHRALIGMINALDTSTHDDSGPDTLRRMLAKLGDYVRDHFGLEERLMGGGGCSPELIGRHFAEHAYFRRLLKDLTTDFEQGRRSVTVPLIEYLVHWFLHHIEVVDRAMTQQLDAAGHDLTARVAAAKLADATGGLSESERRLLTELRRVNHDIERQVQERTRVLTEKNQQLEARLTEMSTLAERLSKSEPPQRAAE